MAVITPTYVYTDNALFNTTEHNNNLYSSSSGRGIMSESNGGLDSNNLTSGFEIQDHHIAPETAVRVRSDTGRDSVDYFSDEAVVGDTEYNKAARNVASCGVRFYVPFPGLLLFNAQFFVNYFRLYIGTSDAQESSPNNPYGILRYWLSINSASGDDLIETSIRSLPCSAWLDNATQTLENHEDEVAFAVNLHHTLRGQSAGWYDVQLRVQLVPDEGNNKVDIDRTLPGNTTSGTTETVQFEHSVFMRATFGVRNATVLALMQA